MANKQVLVNARYIKVLTTGKQELVCAVCSKPFMVGDVIFSKTKSGKYVKRGKQHRIRYHLMCWLSLFH